MKHRPRHTSVLALAVLFAGPVAAVDQTEIHRNMYAKGYIDYPPPANRPGDTSIGVDPLAVEMRLAYLEEQNQARQLAERERFDQERTQRDTLAERERRWEQQEAERMARMEEQRRLQREQQAMSEPGDRSEAELDQQALADTRNAGEGKQIVVWSRNPQQDPRAEEPNVVAVVPPVAESALREMQQGLSAAGYEVRVNGRWDAQTYQALTRFQQSEGLASEGLMEPETLVRLDAMGGQRQRAQAGMDEEAPRG